MKGRIHLGIATVAILSLAGCSSSNSTYQPAHYHNHFHHHNHALNPHHSEYKGEITGEEPRLIPKPLHFSGRTWFDTDKATLRARGKTELSALAKRLLEAKQSGLISDTNKVAIIGHTDSRASHSYNQRLSERRAAAVAQYLQSQGVPSAALMSKGKGETQPVASNRTRTGMQKNRRVEIFIHGASIKVVYH